MIARARRRRAQEGRSLRPVPGLGGLVGTAGGTGADRPLRPDASCRLKGAELHRPIPQLARIPLRWPSLSARRTTTAASSGLDLDGDFLAAVQTSGTAASRAPSAPSSPGRHHATARSPTSTPSPTPQGLLQGSTPSPAACASASRTSRSSCASSSCRRSRTPKELRGRRPLPGGRGDRHAARRGRARLPGDRRDDHARGRAPACASSSVAARESMVARVVDAVRAAGLRPEGIDLNAFALVRTLVAAAPTRPSPRASTATSAGVTNLAIALGPICLFTRPLSTVVAGRGRAGRRGRARRGDPPVDRLLHGAARGALGRRGRAVGPRRRVAGLARAARLGLIDVPVSRRRAARPAAVHSDSRGRGSLPPHRRGRPRARSSGMRRRQPSPREAPPAQADRRQGRAAATSRSASSASCCSACSATCSR